MAFSRRLKKIISANSKKRGERMRYEGNLWHGKSGLSQNLKDENFLVFMKGIELPIRIGILYNLFTKRFPDSVSYRTFQRMMKEYADREIIKAKTTPNMTIIEKVNEIYA